MEKIVELKMKPGVTMESMVERTRKTLIPVYDNQKVIWVGWQFHFVVEGNEESVLQSLGGYAKGFKMEDYEGK